jgi:hypothetical protein
VLAAVPATAPLQETADLFFLFRARGPMAPPADVAIVPIDRRASQSIAVPRDADARAQNTSMAWLEKPDWAQHLETAHGTSVEDQSHGRRMLVSRITP